MLVSTQQRSSHSRRLWSVLGINPDRERARPDNRRELAELACLLNHDRGMKINREVNEMCLSSFRATHRELKHPQSNRRLIDPVVPSPLWHLSPEKKNSVETQQALLWATDQNTQTLKLWSQNTMISEKTSKQSKWFCSVLMNRWQVMYYWWQPGR